MVGFGRLRAAYVSAGIMICMCVGSLSATAQAPPAVDPCEPYPRDAKQREAFIKELINTYGYSDFFEPNSIRPTSEAEAYNLVVQYATGLKLAGCNVELRSYNGKLVGSTIRAKPGETLFIRLTNKLPAGVVHDHPQDPHSPDHSNHFSFNITNLHTHGLHTSPSGNSDNVFLQIFPEKHPGDPAGTQLYKIHIHENHPSGTFWYHAHFHGSTAVQVSSGMAGALIIEGGKDANGGLDTVPEVAAAEQKVFVLQQIRFGPDGKLEDFDKAIPTRRWSRNITVNGVFVPTIRLRPGEVQRWRFVHAGVEENIALALDGHQLHEIAADGLALGRVVSWPSIDPTSDGFRELLLGPGYRTEVLVQAAPLAPGESSKEYFLRDRMLPASLSLQAATSALMAASSKFTLSAADLLIEIGSKPERVIARVVVEGEPKEMKLPASSELAGRVPTELAPVRDEELTGTPQEVRFDGTSLRTCTPDGDCSKTCDVEAPDCKRRLTLNERVFMPQAPPRVLQLNRASKWSLSGEGVFTHPFHIHVNPFEIEREEPGPDGKIVRAKVWKDTILLPSNGRAVEIRSRYTKFEGEFVIHCHILGHEDMGMMERIRIEK